MRENVNHIDRLEEPLLFCGLLLVLAAACAPPGAEPAASIAGAGASAVTCGYPSGVVGDVRATICTGYDDALEHDDLDLAEGQVVSLAGAASFAGFPGTHGWVELDAVDASGRTLAILKWWYLAPGAAVDLAFTALPAPAGTVAVRLYREAYCSSYGRRPGDLTIYGLGINVQ